MPTYQYACTSCGERLEVVQKFTDDPLTVCPSCEGALRKVFSAVGVVFKGSGFYKTDSRAKTSSSGDSGSGDSGGAKKDAAPAAKTESTSSATPAASAPAAKSA
jgi:putative FmdB family regulatory protein